MLEHVGSMHIGLKTLGYSGFYSFSITFLLIYRQVLVMPVPANWTCHSRCCGGVEDLWCTNFSLLTLYSFPFLFPFFIFFSYSLLFIPSLYFSCFPAFVYLHSFHVSSSPGNKHNCLSTLSMPSESTANETAYKCIRPVAAVTFLKPCQQIAVCHVSQSLAQGDLPQVPGSEGLTVVVKHDCRIDCTEHCNSW